MEPVGTHSEADGVPPNRLWALRGAQLKDLRKWGRWHEAEPLEVWDQRIRRHKVMSVLTEIKIKV